MRSQHTRHMHQLRDAVGVHPWKSRLNVCVHLVINTVTTRVVSDVFDTMLESTHVHVCVVGRSGVQEEV